MASLKGEEGSEPSKEAESLSEENLSGKYALLELIEEMLARGLRFAPVSRQNSQAASFTILDDQTILPPFAALDRVSEANGRAIVEERAKGDFFSRSDFQQRTGLNKKALESLVQHGLLDDLPVSNQMSFFAGF
jgi:DNA polymerase-3 subunit alpha (Gram-positive type)